jgi:hypothetical protein
MVNTGTVPDKGLSFFSHRNEIDGLIKQKSSPDERAFLLSRSRTAL